MSLRFRVGSVERDLVVEQHEHHHRIRIGERDYQVRILHAQGAVLDLEVDGRRVRAHLAHGSDRTFVHLEGRAYEVERIRAGAKGASASPAAFGDEVISPMPGQVLQVLVSAGDEVTSNQPVAILEAMKMELKLRAPRDGKVAAVGCEAGSVVERDQVLIELEPA